PGQSRPPEVGLAFFPPRRCTATEASTLREGPKMGSKHRPMGDKISHRTTQLHTLSWQRQLSLSVHRCHPKRWLSTLGLRVRSRAPLLTEARPLRAPRVPTMTDLSGFNVLIV